MKLILSALLAMTVPCAAAFAGQETPVPGKVRNVVLVVADDLGMQAGCYGDKVIKTPHLDSLASQGVRFTRGFCTTASCSASRSVILTGLYNHATGHYGHAHADHHFSTYDSVRTLPVLLAEGGYRTCSIGKYHVAPESTYHFETYRNDGIQGSRNAVWMAQNARAWIAEQDERPFFLYFCSTDPHRGGGPDGYANFNDDPAHYPGVTPVRYKPAEIVVPPWLPDRPEVRQELAEYYQAISRLDQGLGVLLQALRDTGHADDTLILFISDNGPPFPGAKTTLYHPGMNLPLIVRHPGVTAKGTTCDAMVTWADITPTILDACGVQPKPSPPVVPRENGEKPRPNAKPQAYRFHGRSFLPVLGEDHPRGWDECYASHTFHEITMYYPMRAVLKGRYKLILNLAHQLPYPFASDLYASPTWQGVLKRQDATYGKRSVEDYVFRPREELYDLDADPDELRNLVNDPQAQAVLQELRDKLKAWQQATKDPWISKYRYE